MRETQLMNISGNDRTIQGMGLWCVPGLLCASQCCDQRSRFEHSAVQVSAVLARRPHHAEGQLLLLLVGPFDGIVVLRELRQLIGRLCSWGHYLAKSTARATHFVDTKAARRSRTAELSTCVVLVVGLAMWSLEPCPPCPWMWPFSSAQSTNRCR
jgi:hypothetical protein